MARASVNKVPASHARRVVRASGRLLRERKTDAGTQQAAQQPRAQQAQCAFAA